MAHLLFFLLEESLKRGKMERAARLQKKHAIVFCDYMLFYFYPPAHLFSAGQENVYIFLLQEAQYSFKRNITGFSSHLT